MRSRNPNSFMWYDAVEMFERADRLHRQFFQPSRNAAGPCWEPPVDVLETESEIWIMVALPGVEPDCLKVVIDEGGTLVVAGERPMPRRMQKMMLRRLEIPHGHFERRLELPAGRYEIGERDLRNGCLILSLRKIR